MTHTTTPRADDEIIEEYRKAHFTGTHRYFFQDLRRSALIRLANLAPDFWGARVRNPLFVIGCARSGTTLLQSLLAQHRDIANWSEASILWDPSGYYWSVSARETPPLWVDPEGYTARWRRDNLPRGREIRASFGLFQGITRKPYLLNKNPENLFRIPDILSIFPEAHIVHIVRDGRAVVSSSLKRMLRKVEKWPEFHRLAEVDFSEDEMAVRMSVFWRKSMCEVESQDRALNLKAGGKLLEIRYEDLCENRSEPLRQICELVGLRGDRFQPAVWRMPVESRNFKWKQRFTPQLVEQMEAAMQPKLADWGYV